MLVVDLQGGFGEKGRTSLRVSDGRTRIVLDAGIKVGARGEDYYPLLTGPVEQIDALFISHAHEDHMGALCRILSLGYRGPVFMTVETRAEMLATLEQYADPGDLRRFPPRDEQIRLFRPGDGMTVKTLGIATGHSGHVAGGVWFCVSGAGRCVAYAADMVPRSTVFRIEPLPPCDLLVLDASYGADPIPGEERAGQIAAWVAAHRAGCLLPTPLSGRSLELIALLEAPFAIEAGMRAPLAAQIAAAEALQPGQAKRLGDKLASARDWRSNAPLPDCPLLVHDGMGVAGPARRAILAAESEAYPVLLTGHLPDGSPGAVLAADGRADWIRMPTHPTMPENVALWAAAGRPLAFGHSCDPQTLCALHEQISTLDTQARTGARYIIGEAGRDARSGCK